MSDTVLPLAIGGLAHAYDRPVFRDVALTLEPREFVTVLGASGCGKSTLLRAVAGLVTPARGTIRIGGELVVEDGIERVPVERRAVGLVFQDYALFPHQSVRQNVAFGLRRPDRSRVDHLLDLIDMRVLESRLPAELSGGQQQRVAVARALAPRPRVLLLDEPFANVDARLRGRIGSEIRALARQEGSSVLMVTHERSEALSLSDRVAVLAEDGDASRVHQSDVPDVVYRRPATRAVAEAVGDVIVLAGEASGDVASTPIGEAALAAPMHGAVTLLVRPEQLAFEARGDGPARVERVAFQGHRWLAELEQDGLGLQAVIRAGTAVAGARGVLRFVEPVWGVHGHANDR